MESATLSTAFTSFRRHVRPDLPHRPIHASWRRNQTSPLPISSTGRRQRFDVFLSFHGHDARHRIVDHLYAALLRKGTKPFKDDTEMERGLDVEEAISTAIEDSSIYLLLLSPGYASSAFCMDEAVEIMQRCGSGSGSGGRVALPIFYLISPDDVSLPTAGCFKQHFLSHFDKFTYGRVQGWMDAFSSIGKIGGWVHENGR
ncbi:unnamed protein product [Linum trigynum]